MGVAGLSWDAGRDGMGSGREKPGETGFRAADGAVRREHLENTVSGGARKSAKNGNETAFPVNSQHFPFIPSLCLDIPQGTGAGQAMRFLSA
jgi:hypothetical protein